jgi:ADP-heptose:LPS heptosyltransferase
LKLNFRRGSAFASKKAKTYLENITPEDVRKITVIRHAAIGDFMNIRPFLVELKKFFPNAQITLSVNKSAMYGMPEDLIDNVHIMDKDDPNDKSKKTGLFYRIKQAKELPPQDIIFDLTDSTMKLLLTIFSKAKLKIGYPYRAIRRWFYDIATLRSDFVIEAHSVLHMLNILGSHVTNPTDYGFKNKYTKNEDKQIVYFAGAAEEPKCWEKKKFIKLIEKLSLQYPDYNHIILQGIREDEKFLDIYEPFKNKNNVLLQEVLELDKALQFLSNSRCLISNDTGIRNMAIAVDTPTVGIFFYTGAFRYWPRDDRHDCVFNLDYTSPKVDEVYQSTITLLDKLYA